MQGSKTPKSLRQVHVTAGVGLLGAIAATVVGAPAMAQVVAAADVSGLTVVRRRPNLPPTIDSAAPYKADLSASGKLTQPLLDTPRSVSVLTEDLFDDLGAMNFRDLMRTQPGVTLGTGEGGNAHGDRILIRGFDARNDIYIDGVRDPGRRRGIETSLGRGSVDFPELLGALQERDYRGYLSIERDGSDDPAVEIAQAVQYLSAL